MLEEKDIYRIFNELDIEYKAVHHEALYTIDAAKDIDRQLGVAICKNLFLSTRHGSEFYLLFMEGDKKFNTGKVSKQIGVPRMTFASGEKMEELLGIHPGSVTPLGLLNDPEHRVRFYLDTEFLGNRIGENKVGFLIDSDVVKSEYVSMHPLINTATVLIKTDDLLNKVLPYAKHNYRVVEVGQEG